MKKHFIDIETFPNVSYTWGLFNQFVAIDQIVEPGYTLCWAAKEEGSKKVEFMSVFHDGHGPMIQRMHEILCETDAVVHYNGRKFDVPILNKDFIGQDLPPPDTYQQIDLLETVRRRFRFTSNKLDFVSQFLGLAAKHHHKGMELWHDCGKGDEKAWKEMKKYNIQDVRMLEPFYKKILPWIQNHPNYGLYVDHEDPVCTNCGSRNLVSKGMEHLATQSYRRLKCNDCGTPLRERATALPLSKRKAILTSSKL